LQLGICGIIITDLLHIMFDMPDFLTQATKIVDSTKNPFAQQPAAPVQTPVEQPRRSVQPTQTYQQPTPLTDY
jgi:hypothetical protein